MKFSAVQIESGWIPEPVLREEQCILVSLVEF